MDSFTDNEFSKVEAINAIFNRTIDMVDTRDADRYIYQVNHTRRVTIALGNIFAFRRKGRSQTENRRFGRAVGRQFSVIFDVGTAYLFGNRIRRFNTSGFRPYDFGTHGSVAGSIFYCHIQFSSKGDAFGDRFCLYGLFYYYLCRHAE